MTFTYIYIIINVQVSTVSAAPSVDIATTAAAIAAKRTKKLTNETPLAVIPKTNPPTNKPVSLNGKTSVTTIPLNQNLDTKPSNNLSKATINVNGNNTKMNPLKTEPSTGTSATSLRLSTSKTVEETSKSCTMTPSLDRRFVIFYY